MKKNIPILLALFLITMAFVSAQPKITVGVKPAEPFVTIENNQVSGFSIDLIEKIIEKVDPTAKISYVIDKDLITHLKSVKTGRVDLGIAATSITSARESDMDFSHPFYRSSLGIFIKKGERKGILSLILSKGMLMVFAVIIIYVLLSAHMIWLLEKGNFSKKYLKGIGQGVWWTIVTMSTVGYGDLAPKKPKGRLFGVIVIFSGIAFFGVILASLSSALTLNQLQPMIEGPDDLIGEKVAVIKGSVSSDYINGINSLTVEVDSVEKGILSVKEGLSAAFVHDAPLLQYHLLQEDSELFGLAKETFFPSDYGIVFPQGSKLREDVNQALLEIIEGKDSFYSDLNVKWFGVKS
jgi:polar amino acid transport system substrate-binding protein